MRPPPPPAPPAPPRAFAALARECCALSSETWKHVIELSKFHLQLPFAAARVFGKNIED